MESFIRVVLGALHDRLGRGSPAASLPPDVCELLAEAVGVVTFRVGTEVSGAWFVRP